VPVTDQDLELVQAFAEEFGDELQVGGTAGK